MRRKVIRLSPDCSVETALRSMIKHRVGGLLIEHAANSRPAGVLSKTDIMGAFYADLPITIKVGDIMSRPVLSCRPEDSLEAALALMKDYKITRLFVNSSNEDVVTGVLAYPEVVGLMYRHCHYCRKSLFKGQYISGKSSKAILRLTVNDIMAVETLRLPHTATIEQVMEVLSGAVGPEVLICDDAGTALGVVTITDVVMAYRHGRKQTEPAKEIMTAPIKVCQSGAMLEEAIKTMIFADVGRLFVQDEKSAAIIGVIGLADAAKARSGSCQACIVSRISPKD